MKKEKNIIIIVSILILLIISFSVFISIKQNISNKKEKDNQLYLVIYQYEVSNYNINYNKDKVLYKKIEFNYELELDEIITSLDKSGYNHLVVSNGVAKITEADCLNHICMGQSITLDNDFLNNKEIICMPNGLVISLETN